MDIRDFEKIEAIIWSNKKLEKALDEILIDYEDKIFDEWLMQEFASLPESERIKKLEEIGAFDFCGWTPMEWAFEYCEDAVSAIYDEDDKFDEDELIENLIIHCKENMMLDMFAQCDF